MPEIVAVPAPQVTDVWVVENHELPVVNLHVVFPAGRAEDPLSKLGLAALFGLDAVMGAFVAGVLLRRYAPPGPKNRLAPKIEALAFGFFGYMFALARQRGLLLKVQE